MSCRVLKSGNHRITSSYGSRNSGYHYGVDIVKYKSELDYITAHSDGIVVDIQDGHSNNKKATGRAAWGNFVKLSHSGGYYTLYAHMKKGLSLKVGDKVKKGQVVGYMSDSGEAHGGHLHFEVYEGNTRINPTEYLTKALPGEKETSKSIDELAREVIDGKYGNGEERKKRLGSLYRDVQNRVNEILLGKSPIKKSNEELAKEVIRGDWGNGEDRKIRLTNAGYNYREIQNIVNRMLS